MLKKKRNIGIINLVVIITTFILLAAALVTKGVTHDLFLELAVFLVSVKLIIATYVNGMLSQEIIKKLDRMEENFRE